MNDDEINEKWDYFKSLLLKTERPNIDKLIEWLDSTDFKYAPASTQYHDACKGGLLRHSLDVYYNMYDFKSFIEFFSIPEDTIIITSLLHDICKVNCYKTSMRNTKNDKGEWIKVPYYEYDDQEPLGHGEKSIIYIYEHDVKLTKIEQAMIRNHMGFSLCANNKQSSDVSKLFSLCPQTLLLCWADELSTYVPGNPNLLEKYRNKLYGRNLLESNNILNQITTENSITINDKTYKLADPNDIVDNINIGEIKLQNQVLKIKLK